MKLMMGLALAGLAASLSGCATVLNGTSQPVAFQSDPSGADIELISGLKCSTPCEYSMKRGNDSRVTFTKPGYEPVMVYIQSRTGGSVAGNILAGGIIGGVVDASNGASNHLYPDPVSVRMVPTGSSEQPVLLDKDGQVISTVAEYNAKVAADVLEGLEGQGQFPSGANRSTTAAH
ncbi:MAG TPA: PEGA domain-containing protein [Croceibacterium sp.]|nr:PEGA domain-containing protein [Croceibacterium sp.]